MTITSRSLAISTQPYEVATRPVGDGTSRTAWMMPVTTRATTEEKARREKRGITAARSPAAGAGRGAAGETPGSPPRPPGHPAPGPGRPPTAGPRPRAAARRAGPG